MYLCRIIETILLYDIIFNEINSVMPEVNSLLGFATFGTTHQEDFNVLSSMAGAWDIPVR
jgi:hypothetical protein